MSSQAVRNNITTNIRRLITEVKKRVIEEGKKKISELKDNLLNPETIIRMLSSDINEDSCSVEGRNKMKEKVDKLNAQLDDIEDIANLGLKTLNELESKISVISTDTIEVNPGETPSIPNPIEAINKITEAIKPVTDLLSIVIQIAPGILAASTGPAANGAVIAGTNNKVNLAKVKIEEFSNLIRTLPRLLDKYIDMANQVIANINKIKVQIESIVSEIEKLRAFIVYLELDFQDKCNKLELPEYPPNPDPPTPPPYPTLEDIIKESEELYGNILEDLITRGDSKAIRRVYALGVELQRIKNTKVEIINI